MPLRLQATEDDVYHLMDLKEQYFIMTAICSVAEGISAYFFIYQKRCWDLVYLCTALALAIILLLRQAIKISRSVMAPMAFSRTERMKHFMEALSMGKGLKFSLRAFKKPLLTEEEYQLLSYLQREGDVSYHLKCLKEKAKSRESHLEDSLQEQIQREFISRVAQLYYKKQLVIDNIRREDCLEANGTSVLAQAVKMLGRFWNTLSEYTGFF